MRLLPVAACAATRSGGGCGGGGIPGFRTTPLSPSGRSWEENQTPVKTARATGATRLGVCVAFMICDVICPP